MNNDDRALALIITLGITLAACFVISLIMEIIF